MQRVIVETADGSSSVYIPEFDESYHSKYGSIQESQLVFIRSGLEAAVNGRSEISVLEIGFGTGLNAFLTYLFAKSHQIKIVYHAVEPFPLEQELYTRLNYPVQLQADAFRENFIQMHESGWKREAMVQPGFMLHKYAVPVRDLKLEEKIDVIYYDAFAPRVQPELWTQDVFTQMYDLLNTGSILVTYCAKGEVKRNMRSAGFSVETLPGPAGKREMTRAIK
jgi:tRNA U34 5-methylaminomethyl-2-thiouridine-forming methyltransferase MnmC